jgi:hypothetical protein
VFKKYSQMKLGMKREALAKLNGHANESAARKSFDTAEGELWRFDTVFVRSRQNRGVREWVKLLILEGNGWYAREDSNLWPFAPEANALSSWATGA